MAARDEVLTAEQVSSRLASLDGWHGDTTGISKDYSVDYDTAIQIVTDIGKAAIELEHRPDIDIRWGLLRIFITTHTAGDVVTELDFLLVSRLDEIVNSHETKSA